ncbi:Pyrrolo-quinoline quinone [Chthoniobacter flavus Ellin428]|uniref:Pyrrolo-quinoline quinone n=1 Tax=Chthoniobacter flavus Ellin428 TaxID=497964 RepID=B4D939_9BACT|nr:PQQ-binding-like beta-propeller repeat protein [Chthoniobacter flavus]EDY17084.1 Pyrrolo-quinoline quinone [Chthoniobacter flavus Ellin428]TCO86150.1 outer membrane protein assembly factor BamB [Chthoniobacter flavus]
MNAPQFILALSFLALSVRADDWPQWRGPQRDGVWREQGIMESFPSEGLKPLWQGEAGGGWSSPVIAAGRVFLHDSVLTKPTAHERVRAFDAVNGKLLWTYAYDVDYPEWAFGADQNGGPTSTPTVAEGKVYTLGANGALACLAAATGEVLWKKDLAREYAVQSFTTRASPLVDGDRLILYIGGKPGACLVALDRHTGREVWKALDEPATNSSPIILTAAGRRQLIVWTASSISALDPVTGTTLWREPLTTTSYDCNATPVWRGERLLVSGLMLKLDDEKPGASVLWPENRAPLKRVLSNTSTPLLTDAAVFSATNKGDLVCLDARTGQQLWRTDKVTDRQSGPSIHLTPNDGAVFLFTNKGELIRARLSAAGYEEISRVKVIEPVYPFGGRKVAWTPPAFANHCIFVRNERELICVSLAVKAP